MVESTVKSLRLTIPGQMYGELHQHLFPGDGDEHGAVILAGLANMTKGPRLLARELILARDGVDYVPGKRGYRRLKAEFITPLIHKARDQRLVYLAIHNHGGVESVCFSPDDLASHERGYPTLLDVTRGVPVGALVLAKHALAGDIWMNSRERTPISETVILGASRATIYPYPVDNDFGVGHLYDRQVRLFGDKGQKLLSKAKVAIIGLGGAGSQLAVLLARLGVGKFVLCDPDRVDETNLPRLEGGRWWHAMTPMLSPTLPDWVNEFARRNSTLKVTLAQKNIRACNPTAHVTPIMEDFFYTNKLSAILDCDYIFLAADSMRARLLFNAIVHQHLIPGVQVGAKIVPSSEDEPMRLFSVVRPVMPDHGCLWCNGLINPVKLQDEFASTDQLRAQNYGLGNNVISPSVNTLNATATATAANDFMLWYTGLSGDIGHRHYIRFTPLDRTAFWEAPRGDGSCMECGRNLGSRLAMGVGCTLPNAL